MVDYRDMVAISPDGRVITDDRVERRRDDYGEHIRVHDDQIESYGGIIRDLTDVKKLIDEFELKLQGKKLEGNKIVEVKDPVYKLSEFTATQLGSLLRSIANQNTHFTLFEPANVRNTLVNFNYTINLLMLRQGDKIPLGVRQKISFEMICIAQASLQKAASATILKWTKGSFNEGVNRSDVPLVRRSWTDYIPFLGRRR